MSKYVIIIGAIKLIFIIIKEAFRTRNNIYVLL